MDSALFSLQLYRMIITKTPFRMSFFGGGTDIEQYFRLYGGSVLSTGIDKYCYVTVRKLPPYYDYTNELAYAVIERVKELDEIRHPAIREAMRMTGTNGIRLAYEADLPARSGLGTSSSFAVGMLNAFYAMKGLFADKKKLADDAIYLERTLCNEAGGWQDQIAAAFGGFNRINFHAEGYSVTPVCASPERKQALKDRLMLFFTGFTHYSIAIQEKSVQKLSDNLSVLSEMRSLVDTAEGLLVSPSADLDDFGRLLDYEWKLKKSTNPLITTEKIDSLYEKGLAAGAIGGKLLGAGGGGYLLFYVPAEKQHAVRHALSELKDVPFAFENTGTSIMHYVRE